MTVRFLEELNPLEQLSLLELSYSRLNTFDMCPAMYYWQYCVKEPSEKGEPAVLGNVLHSVLENVLEPEEYIDEDILLDEFETQISTWDPEGDILSVKSIEAGSQMIKEFVDRHDGETFKILEKEKEFKVVIGRGFFRGFIDRIDQVGDTIVVTDYKSGYREVTYKQIANDLQLGLYALVAHKYYPRHQIKAQLYYLRSGRIKGHVFSLEDLERIEAELIRKTEEIINVTRYGFTSNPRICGFCSYAKPDQCSYGAYKISPGKR